MRVQFVATKKSPSDRPLYSSSPGLVDTFQCPHNAGGGVPCQRKSIDDYSPEFKRHALKRASEDGITDKAVCADLGISERQLRRW
jgi:hypothetical protein